MIRLKTIMDFGKNSKRAKNGSIRKDQQKLLVAYSGEDQGSDSDSDRVQPLELPPTRLRRPKSRKIHVVSPPKNCCSLWNFCQVVFVVVIIGTMVCMVGFTFILKTSLDTMKRKIMHLETSDRSTAKGCADLNTELGKKLEVLRGGEIDLTSTEKMHFKSLLRQIAHLNRTVVYLNKKLKSPKSVLAINHDIRLLKKGMADTGREMTEVSDKVNQLRKIAHLQNINLKYLKQKVYNLSVQFAKLSGQPSPSQPFNTATPPWLLRLPADSGIPQRKKVQALETETLRKNISSEVTKEIGRVLGILSAVNGTLMHQIHNLHNRLTGLGRNVSRHMAVIDSIIKKVQRSRQHKNSTSTLHSVSTVTIDDSLVGQINNLTSTVTLLVQHMNVHDASFSDLAADVTSINHTLHKHMAVKHVGGAVVQASCNCSQPLGEMWKAMYKDEQLLHSLKSGLNSLKESVKYLMAGKGESSTSASTSGVLLTTASSRTSEQSVTNLPSTAGGNYTPTEQPTTEVRTTAEVIASTTAKTTTGRNSSTERFTPTTQPNSPKGEKAEEEKELSEDKRTTDEDDIKNSNEGQKNSESDSEADDLAENLPKSNSNSED